MQQVSSSLPPGPMSVLRRWVLHALPLWSRATLCTTQLCQSGPTGGGAWLCLVACVQPGARFEVCARWCFRSCAQVRLDDPSMYQSIVDAEWNIIYDKLDK